MKSDREKTIREDLELAREISEGVSRGDNVGIAKIAHFDPIFRNFARKKLCLALEPEDVVNDFWVKKIIKGNVLENYRGDNNSRLLTFCLSVLKFHIMDENRKVNSERLLTVSPEILSAFSAEPSDNCTLSNCEESDDSVGTSFSPNNHLTPDQFYELYGVSKPHAESVEDRNLANLVEEALFRLKAVYPQDAAIIFQKMQGSSFKEIAASICADPNPKKAENKIKKQYNRKDSSSSSLFRFSVILERLLVEQNCALSLLNDQVYFVDSIVSEEQIKLFQEVREEALASMEKKNLKAALKVKVLLSNISFSEFALFFGTINGFRIHASARDSHMKEYDRALQNVLKTRNIFLSIEQGVPFLRNDQKSVTL